MKKHPYILATLAAALLATAVWLCMPSTYTATTKLSDEYRETDISIGLSVINAQIRDATGSSNIGINDMEVYCKVLKAEDFSRAIAGTLVDGTGKTYGEYLETDNPQAAVSEHISYNYSSRTATLTIGFTDRNALVASQMLDSVTALLQTIVTENRHSISKAAYDNAEKELAEARRQYEEAQRRLAAFEDSHTNTITMEVGKTLQTLRNEAGIAQKHYVEASTQHARQKYLRQREYTSFAVVQENTVPLKDNRSFPVCFTAILILFLLFTKALLLAREKRGHDQKLDFGDFFSPWSLTIFIWGADIALYFLQGTMDPIGPKFISCFTLWLATLLPSSLLAYWLTRESPVATDYSRPLEVPMRLFNVLCAIAGIVTFVYAMRIWGIVSQFDTKDLLFNLRLYIIEDNSVTGLLNHIQGVNFALFAVGIWAYPKVSKWQLAYIVAVNLVFEIFRMEKSGILIMILSTMFLLYERRLVRVRTLLLTFAGIIVLFFFFNLSKESSDSESESTFLDFFGMYVTSPIVAFEHLTQDIGGAFGQNTLCILYPYFNMLGFDFQYVDRLQEFVWVPIPTNVYTIMQPFYNDFGMWGIGFFGILYGAFFGWAYRHFREGAPVFICIYSYLVEVIMIQFYNENLLQNIVLFMEFCFFVTILTQKKFRLVLMKA